ncbi:MAG: response regulator [Ferruginibacter sp.]
MLQNDKLKQSIASDKLNCKILIVDDEGDICYLLSKLFKQRNLDFEQVNTLEQAQIFLKESAPDIIFLDHNLPDGLGINYIEKIKEAYPSTKIVIITAEDGASTKNKAMRKGADLFLNKPFTSEQVYNCIDLLNCSQPL